MNRDKRVKRDPAGTWSFVADLPSADGGRRQARRRGFPTSKAANDALHELLESARAGLPAAGARGGLTVAGYLTGRWLPALAGQGLRPTTIESYRRITVNHLVPRLGRIKLAALDAATVEAMLGDLAATTALSGKTRSNVLGVLSKALADAMRWRLIGANPAAAARPPRTTRPAPRVWDTAQLGVFLAHVEGDRAEPLWRFIVATGCRRGEAAGLRWADLDLPGGRVTITSQRTMAGSRVIEGPPKTASGGRTIALDPDTAAVLQTWRRGQRAEMMRLGIRTANAYVFTTEAGAPLAPQWITRRFRGLCDTAGLPRIGVHGLRHSAATWLLTSGMHPKLVSQRLGHASPATTLAIYCHVMPGDDQAAADAYAAALGAARPNAVKM